MAQRLVNAENSFIECVRRDTGFTQEQAEKVLAFYVKHKLMKLDAVDGRFYVKHGPDRHKRKWKTYTASDVFADQALSNEPKGGAFVPRTNYRILPATLANLSEHNAALRADEEIAARQLRQAEALKRSRDERNAAIDRRREALTRILHEVNSLDADQREALRWAIKENARDPDTTL